MRASANAFSPSARCRLSSPAARRERTDCALEDGRRLACGIGMVAVSPAPLKIPHYILRDTCFPRFLCDPSLVTKAPWTPNRRSSGRHHRYLLLTRVGSHSMARLMISCRDQDCERGGSIECGIIEQRNVNRGVEEAISRRTSAVLQA